MIPFGAWCHPVRLGSAATRRHAAAELRTRNVQRTNSFPNQSPLNFINSRFPFSGCADGFDLERVSVSVAGDANASLFNCDPLH